MISNKKTVSFQKKSEAKSIGLVSLGCPKALVDSEVLITKLKNLGYEISPSYETANAVIVNTCGFLDSAKVESLNAIEEALIENGKVIVTGCLGAKPEIIKKTHPNVLAITGPQKFDAVLETVQKVAPIKKLPFEAKAPENYFKLTPQHYSYLKISEGCNHKCSFCIIPSMRGKLTSRPLTSIIREAKNLVAKGTKELIVISQDTSAYGLDLRYEETNINGQNIKTDIFNLADQLGDLDAWIRLHYIYPYPHVEKLIPLMANKKVLPYLDVPFQHAHPNVLKRMARPSSKVHDLEQINKWRSICPDISIRSTFIVGFPGETEAEFEYLLDWLDIAKIDRVGCFKYENVEGARAQDLKDQVPEDIKEERFHRFMLKAKTISERKLKEKVTKNLPCIIDKVEQDFLWCRTQADAPEVDGIVKVINPDGCYQPGDIINVNITKSLDYDLEGTVYQP